ncbi:SdrD B-like domain-containing protein, partial [Staphylococcus chromogenes]
EATKQNVGSKELDSDGQVVNVKVEGSNNYTIDSGFVKTEVEPPKPESSYEIGDYVWEDTNKDGVQNREEKGLTGVTVILKDKEGNE